MALVIVILPFYCTHFTHYTFQQILRFIWKFLVWKSQAEVLYTVKFSFTDDELVEEACYRHTAARSVDADTR